MVPLDTPLEYTGKFLNNISDHNHHHHHHLLDILARKKNSRNKIKQTLNKLEQNIKTRANR